jgi:hypothetical protein
MTDLIIRYEEVGLTEDETVELFQYLVDTGIAWTLQGFYGRQAMALIEMGLVTRPIEPKAAKVIKEISAKPKKPKLRRGRPSTKQRGAMVEMAQRRKKGQGIIVDRIEDVVPEELAKSRNGVDTSFTIKAMKKKGHVGWGVLENDKCSNFVLVHWFNKPSEYEENEIGNRIVWYPDKWVRVVSPAPPEKKD